MKKKYRIRDGSIAYYALSAGWLILFVAVASICTAITGTW